MINIHSTLITYQGDIDAVNEWCEEIYTDKFAIYFSRVRELYQRFKSNSTPISDSELEEILTVVPLELFSVSEALNKFRVSYDTIKLGKKARKCQLAKSSEESSEAKRNAEAELLTTEDEILLVAFAAVITRVENEISFTRELIMSAKKLWDRRRNTESANPISDVVVDTSDELPAYNAKRPIYG